MSDVVGYTITRVFDATPEMVWEAWTKPEHFAVWFGTDATQMIDVELDVRPGGKWRGTMIVPDGREIHWVGIYREVVEPKRLVIDFTDSGGYDGIYDFFTVTIAPQGDRTEMTLTQSGGHLSPEEYERARIGTNSFLDTMESLFGTTIKGRHETA